MSESFILSKINKYARKDGFSPAESISMAISEAAVTPEAAIEREMNLPKELRGRPRFSPAQLRTMRLRDYDDDFDPLKGRTKFGRQESALFRPYTEEEAPPEPVRVEPEKKEEKAQEPEPVVEKPGLDTMSDEDLLFERL